MPATERHTERSKGICIEHKSAARSVPRASASMIPSVPLPQFLTHFATLPPLLHPSKLPRIYSPRTMRFAKARSLFRPADSWPRYATRDPCPSESNGKEERADNRNRRAVLSTVPETLFVSTSTIQSFLVDVEF